MKAGSFFRRQSERRPTLAHDDSLATSDRSTMSFSSVSSKITLRAAGLSIFMGEKNSSNSSSEPSVKLLVVLSGEKKA